MRFYTFLLVTICLCFGCESKVKSNIPKSEDPLLKSIEIPTNEKGEIINSEMPQLNLLENKIDFGTVEAGKTYTRQYLKFHQVVDVQCLDGLKITLFLVIARRL